ncbi:hypothetical protein [Candidatus Mycoplasma haematohominis]|uniref:Uncharacterized protein n=1 Tax=Candidatus Mycoplasma haematohominis TaxID=1494318 RepID=A0A478FQI0_9MOLU|nr:hypothetical protein [Candidatus Mycoplasma haemohominis]GCE63751.1 hypothetical protein MHSWG343_07510 [Candidatus Mycoplasma haemohominis]
MHKKTEKTIKAIVGIFSEETLNLLARTTKDGKKVSFEEQLIQAFGSLYPVFPINQTLCEVTKIIFTHKKYFLDRNLDYWEKDISIFLFGNLFVPKRTIFIRRGIFILSTFILPIFLFVFQKYL